MGRRGRENLMLAHAGQIRPVLQAEKYVRGCPRLPAGNWASFCIENELNCCQGQGVGSAHMCCMGLNS